MRGGDNRTGELFSYVDLEARVRRDHPVRAIRTIVNAALSALEREFTGLYSPIGRKSVSTGFGVDAGDRALLSILDGTSSIAVRRIATQRHAAVRI